MTGNLIKFEIRSCIRLLSALWAALIVASLCLGIEGKIADKMFQEDSSVLINILGTVLPIIYGLTFAAMVVAVIILIVTRFYKGLLGEEGYLMHTLPVKEWQLIASKGISALIMVVATGIVIMISILFSCGLAGLDLPGMFQAIADDIGNDKILIPIGLEFIVVGIAAILAEIYQIYAALSIGQLSGKHRILASIGAYIGIDILMNIIGVAIACIMIKFEAGVFEAEEFAMADFQLMLVGTFGLMVVSIAVFHIVTERMLTLKLNLQ